MRIAHIKNGVVVNVIEGDTGLVNGVTMVASDSANIGDSFDGQSFTPAPVVDTRTYAQKRAAEYPPMQDYIDGMVKGDQVQIAAYIAACQAVKLKYPKV